MAINLVHTGDVHIDSDANNTGINKKTGRSLAWESHQRAFASVCRAAIDNAVDAFIVAGDNFADGRPSQEALLLFTDTLLPVAKAGIPIILEDGNHERLRAGATQRTTTSTLGAILSEHGEVHVVHRDPRLVRLKSGIQVACLPWLSKTAILAKMGEDRAGAVEGDRLLVQYALDALESMCDEADVTSPLIMASHVTVDDVRLDSVAKGHKRGSEVEMAHIFAEPILPRKALDDSPISYAGLSHIHARQRMGQKSFYAGAPDRFTLTDADDPKSANLVTISDANVLEKVEFIETDSRPMHVIDLNADDAEERIEAMQESAVLGFVLAPGESQVPDSIMETVRDRHGVVVSTVSTPIDRPRQTAVVLPEKTDTVTALSTWLSEKRPDTDPSLIVSLAASLVEEGEPTA